MDPITLRFVERILAVAVGGMAIYLGYRLFLKVPEHRTGEGKFVLPWDISIILSRVGPGVFFALFGAAVVGVSLFRAVEYHSVPPREKVSGSTVFTGAGASLTAGDRELRANARAELHREFAILNNIASKLKPNLPAQDRTEVELAIPRIKFALMKPVWGDPSEGWDDAVRFEEWLKDGQSDPPPKGLEKVVEYFRYGGKQVNP